MSWTNSKNNKCCATCVNWGGPRTVATGKLSLTDSCNVRGVCYEGVPADATQGPSACGGRNCSKYQLWGALK